MSVIEKDARVRLHFSLAFAQGSQDIIDSTFDGQPAEMVIGDGNLPEGFESFLFGMEAGEEKQFLVSPEKAFGQRNPNNVQKMKRADFKNLSLEKGLVVSFEDAAKQETPGVILSFDEQQVLIDFNHPLAGKTLNFRVLILEVNASTEK